MDITEVLHKLIDRASFHTEAEVLEAKAAVSDHFAPAPTAEPVDTDPDLEPVDLEPVDTDTAALHDAGQSGY